MEKEILETMLEMNFKYRNWGAKWFTPLQRVSIGTPLQKKRLPEFRETTTALLNERLQVIGELSALLKKGLEPFLKYLLNEKPKWYSVYSLYAHAAEGSRTSVEKLLKGEELRAKTFEDIKGNAENTLNEHKKTCLDLLKKLKAL